MYALFLLQIVLDIPPPVFYIEHINRTEGEQNEPLEHVRDIRL
jgi:hypothetical protein